MAEVSQVGAGNVQNRVVQTQQRQRQHNEAPAAANPRGLTADKTQTDEQDGQRAVTLRANRTQDVRVQRVRNQQQRTAETRQTEQNNDQRQRRVRNDNEPGARLDLRA